MQLVIVSKITMTALVSTLRLLCIEIHPCRIHPSFTIKQIYSIKKKKMKLLLIYDSKMFKNSYHCVNEQRKKF